MGIWHAGPVGFGCFCPAGVLRVPTFQRERGIPHPIQIQVSRFGRYDYCTHTARVTKPTGHWLHFRDSSILAARRRLCTVLECIFLRICIVGYIHDSTGQVCATRIVRQKRHPGRDLQRRNKKLRPVPRVKGKRAKTRGSRWRALVLWKLGHRLVDAKNFAKIFRFSVTSNLWTHAWRIKYR
jgi:hypothetical protein